MWLRHQAQRHHNIITERQLKTSERNPGIVGPIHCPNSGVHLSIFIATTASAEGFLDITFDKSEASGNFFYDISMRTNKDFTTTCELVTPTGTYSFIYRDLYIGGEFYPDQNFMNDHSFMSFAELTAAIAGDWTLTWDAGLSTQTVATISFGTVLDGDFPTVPDITAPIDGLPIKIPGDPNPPTIEWTYGPTPTCNTQSAAFINTYSGTTGQGSGYLPCNTLSWTPPYPLGEGSWLFLVINFIPDYRQVPDGIDIVEGSWFIENDNWLSLRGSDFSQNEIVPTKSSSWGAIKALYRNK